MQREVKGTMRTFCALVAVALLATTLPSRMAAQDGDDDPPGRAARLGFMEGSVSFQPAGESEWVPAVPNRPMTTGDKLWADRDSRAEVELGSVSIHLSANTGFSFLNLDDHTVQIQLNAGAMNVSVRHLGDDDTVEIDTPNQAFSVFRSGRYKCEASEDGKYTMITVRRGEGESTGSGETFTVHQGQTATFSGADRLYADIQQANDPDDFERWSDRRDHRMEDSPSSRYVSRDMVGADDLDEYGNWRPSPEYGNVWYPNVPPGWAPYHAGHWAWIDPWGWTWVDDAPWGYAPFHYGRWAFVEGRWGWVPGPPEVRPVYAPALVVFVGGGGPSMGGNVAWFPLGPREVYVPSYHVSQAYVNRVNVSNTTVSQTTVTNVYNTTVVNNTTVINNVTYANRNVSGAVTAVPQQAFSGGQPVAKAAIPVSRQQIATAPVNARVAVAPTPTAVLGAHAVTGVRVAAPPAAVLNRPVMAKTPPPPAPVSFAAKQQALAAHPGQPIARQEMQRIRPANAPQPFVKQTPPAAPANASGLGNQSYPGNNPAANHPQPTPVMNRLAEPNHGFEPPARNDHPAAAQQNNRPEMNPGAAHHPEDNHPDHPTEPNHGFEPPARIDHPEAAQQNNRPEINPGDAHRADDNHQQQQPPARNDHPAAVQPASHIVSSEPVHAVQSAGNSTSHNASPAPAPPSHPAAAPAPAQARPSQPARQQHPQSAGKPQSQDDKKHQDNK